MMIHMLHNVVKCHKPKHISRMLWLSIVYFLYILVKYQVRRKQWEPLNTNEINKSDSTADMWEPFYSIHFTAQSWPLNVAVEHQKTTNLNQTKLRNKEYSDKRNLERQKTSSGKKIARVYLLFQFGPGPNWYHEEGINNLYCRRSPGDNDSASAAISIPINLTLTLD